ncbi:MAG: mannitol dehydrogenase family protein [Bacteroidales bacterium]|nr:mannitol dehydrogenase family protein [Bacteroidales bacterium]
MKLTDILSDHFDAKVWEEKGYLLPKFNIPAVREKTYREPTWVHFGGGNIFRAFPAALLNDALNQGCYDRGVIVAETFDYEVVDSVYKPHENLSLAVSLRADGSIEKKVIASVTEALKAQYGTPDWERLKAVFRAPSLQLVTFTITEKGYSVPAADLERGLAPLSATGIVTVLLLERYRAGALPLTIQSMDNCSKNGDKVKAAVLSYARKWTEEGLAPKDFLPYLQSGEKVSFPWSMIDKITPRPHEKVKEMLAQDGFEDNSFIETAKHTFTAPFVNAEQVQYLVIEDHYTNGRPPLDIPGGAIFTSRETVSKAEIMKVTTCLNPLHTAMSLYGCMLGYTLISAEMADPDIRLFIQKLGYIEAMPVVTDPGILNPYEFIGEVIGKRFPNPFMPDAPQRIAMDTSQKLPIRFGETIKKYLERKMDTDNLVLIPLVLAGYARYLKGIRDDNVPFAPSPDPLLEELQAIVAPLTVGVSEQDYSCLKKLYSRADIFGVDLYAAGLGERIEGMVKELFAGEGAVRATLHKYTTSR